MVVAAMVAAATEEADLGEVVMVGEEVGRSAVATPVADKEAGATEAPPVLEATPVWEESVREAVGKEAERAVD